MKAVCFSGSEGLGIGYVTQPIGLLPLVQFIHDLIGGAETAKTGDDTENGPQGYQGRQDESL